MSRESEIQTRTADKIKQVYRRHAVVRIKHGTAYAVVGDPDIYGIVWGQGFAFEVKNEIGELTKIQLHRLKEFKVAGAIVGGIRSPEDALRLLDRGLAHLERSGFSLT